MKNNKEINDEIRTLEDSFELSNSNYNHWTSIILTGVILIFTIIQIMLEVFSNNKIGVFIGGLVAYVIFLLIFGPKLFYEMRKTTIKYELIGKGFGKLGVNIKKINNEMKRHHNQLSYFKWLFSR